MTNTSLELFDLRLREVEDGDLPIFFEQQLDLAANRMAAFVAKDPTDRAAFEAHWAKIRSDPEVTIRTILFQGQVAGYLAVYPFEGQPEICYWIGKDYWGRGITTRALSDFLAGFGRRPLIGRAAQDNLASLRIMEKCGFRIAGYGREFANARGEQVEEVILRLD